MDCIRDELNCPDAIPKHYALALDSIFSEKVTVTYEENPPITLLWLLAVS
jgi:hypothetical protein